MKKCGSIEKKQDATKKSSSNVIGSSVFAEVTNRELFGDFDEENSDSRVELVEFEVGTLQDGNESASGTVDGDVEQDDKVLIDNEDGS